MDQLKETNAWLGNRPALDRILQEQGYWFFRDVLDHDAVADLRKKCQATLAGWGVSDPDGEEPLWNGSSLDGIASGLQNMNAKVPELREGRAWEEFVHHPRINAFFESILGSPLEWLKISDYYRIVPPTQDIPDDPYIGRHQDGGGLMGLDCVICWIPLHSIDEKVGGLAVSTGSYNGQLHPDRWFDPDLVKPDGWARAEYHAGDVLMFNPMLIHAGLPNLSNQFRLSLDLRVLRPSSPRPIEGTVVAINNQQVTIRDQHGEARTLRVAPDSHLRGKIEGSDVAIAISADELADYLPAGSPVWATNKADCIAVLRPNDH